MVWELGRQPCQAPSSAILEMPAGFSRLAVMKSACTLCGLAAGLASPSLKGLSKRLWHVTSAFTASLENRLQMKFLSMLGLQGISEVELATRLQLFPVLAAAGVS